MGRWRWAAESIVRHECSAEGPPFQREHANGALELRPDVLNEIVRHAETGYPENEPDTASVFGPLCLELLETPADFRQGLFKVPRLSLQRVKLLLSRYGRRCRRCIGPGPPPCGR